MSKIMRMPAPFKRVDPDNYRKDIKAFFSKTDVCTAPVLKHHPFVVLLDKVEICDSAKKLIKNYPPETEVIAQWRGQWASDFFLFRVSDVKEYLAKLNESPVEDYDL